MWDFFAKLFSSDFMPHGHCYFWQPGVLWLSVASDFVIGISYYSIPFGLVYFVRKREDIVFNWMFLMFASFIFACGTTHFMDIWTTWNGTYRLAGIVKLITAVISSVTAILLWPLISRALEMPSAGEMRSEIEQSIRAQEALQAAHHSLEVRVHDRTTELEASNRILREKTETLERFNRVTRDRELEMARLKNEIDTLLDELKRPRRYHRPEQSLATLKIGERVTGAAKV